MTTELMTSLGVLDQMGYEIEVIPINEYNRLTIEMYDREVFRCDIRNLMFNLMVEDDPVCQRAVKAVKEATNRMCVDENIPGNLPPKGRRDLTNNELTNKGSMQDSLPSDADLLYEIHPEGHQSVNAQSSISSSNKQQMMEEKVGKVTIMEDKNTFQEHGRNDDSSSDSEDSKSED